MYPDQDQTRPYGPPQTARVAHHIFKHGSPRLLIFAVVAGVLGVALGVLALVAFMSYRGSSTAQIHELRQEVAAAQSTLAKAQSRNASGLSSMASQVSGMNAALNGVAQFNTVCSQDLTGPNGPAQFYFACTDQKPG